jgi:hypothetical protein
MKLDLYNKVYEINSLLDPEDEHQLLLNCDPKTQRDIFKFYKSLTISEVSEKLSICVMNDVELFAFNKFVELTGMKYDIKDVTVDVILGNFKTDDYTTNIIINPFLEDILTVDIILDKINIKGLKSLSEVDKKILKLFK